MYNVKCILYNAYIHVTATLANGSFVSIFITSKALYRIFIIIIFSLQTISQVKIKSKNE